MIKKHILLLFALIVCLSAQGQNVPKYVFTQLSVNDGLPQNTVNSFAQDDLGMMWIATTGGLARYDSYSFANYHPDNNSRHSIATDATTSLCRDSKGRIWTATLKGLSLYDTSNGQFRNFSYNGNTPIHEVIELDSIHLLASADGQLVMFNTTDFRFRRLGLCRLGLRGVTELLRYADMVYIGCERGVLQYDIRRKLIKRLPVKGIEGSSVQTLFRSTPGKLYIGTEGNGLFCYDLLTRSSLHLTTRNSQLSSDYIRTIADDGDGNLWIGTVNGLNILDSGNSLQRINGTTSENADMSKTSVRCIYRDKQDGMWVGTFFDGVCYYNPRKNRFTKIQNIPGTNSLSNNIIGCISEAADGNLWIGTNGGLHLYSPSTGRFELFTTANGLLSNDIKAIYTDDRSGTIYVGSQLGGLAMLNARNPHGGIRSVKMPSTIADDNSIYDIKPFSGGRLLLGTLTGLKMYDPQSNAITPLAPSMRGDYKFPVHVRVIHRDAAQHIWIGGEDGLALYRLSNGALRRLPLPKGQPGLASAWIYSIFEDRSHNVWICTSQGLFAISRKQQTRAFTTSDGLPSNVVYAISEDSAGKLWISTGNGMCSIDTRTLYKKYYTVKDGLPSNLFMPGAVCRTHDGTMFFGGINGIVSFRPEQFFDNPFTPPVLITELKIFDHTVQPGDETGVLNSDIEHTKSLRLSHNQSVISLRLAVANYLSAAHNTFAYKLEGYDNTWRYTNDWRTISYSYLPAGTYRFLAKAANNDGKWNDTPTVLQITVLPPWYATWTAKAVYFLLFVALLYALFRFFIEREREKQQSIQEHREQQRKQEMYEMRQRFFIDISHELRTPLTLISSPLEEIMKLPLAKPATEKLSLIQKNVNRLIHLVNQLMDYRRAELGVFKLKVHPVDIASLIDKNFSLYADKAKKHRIKYTWQCDCKGSSVLCDPNYIELIINNLLSNAFKYTPDGRSISVTADTTGDRLRLTVADTGQGIPKDKQQKIFERFYQLTGTHAEGWGIGLSIVMRLVQLHHGKLSVESHVGQGSAFTVDLPATASAYTAEETATAEEISSQDIDRFYSSPEKEDLADDSRENASAALPATADSKPGSGDEPSADSTDERECVLVVEDNDDIRHYLGDALAADYRVLEAANGKEALELAEQNEVNLILSDVMMPEMDGIELCRRIKTDVRTSHIPVIILSAKVDVSEQLEGLQVGADDYIPKPFSLMIVKTKIYNIMRTRQQIIERYRTSKKIEPPKLTVNSLDEKWLEDALRIVNDNIDNEKFSADDFARLMLMSRTSFYAKMKAITGESVKEFVRRIRLNRAAELILKGENSIAEISYMVGFTTPSYFTTSFKKHFGCLPTEYTSENCHS